MIGCASAHRLLGDLFASASSATLNQHNGQWTEASGVAGNPESIWAPFRTRAFIAPYLEGEFASGSMAVCSWLQANWSLGVGELSKDTAILLVKLSDWGISRVTS